jgi:hypothetical protein
MKSTLPSTQTREGASDKEVNIHLDKVALRQEQPDYDAPWFDRRFFATMWSTVKAWFAPQ